MPTKKKTAVKKTPEPATPTKTSFKLTRPIGKVCDPESTRYALGAVQVIPETDKTVLCLATDARMLAVIREDGTADKPRLVPCQLTEIPKNGFRKIDVDAECRATRYLVSEKRPEGFQTNDPVQVLPEADGRFPRADGVLPLGKKIQTLRIDTRLLSKLAEAIGEKGVVTIFWEKASNVFGVVGEHGIGKIMLTKEVPDALEKYNDMLDALKKATNQ